MENYNGLEISKDGVIKESNQCLNIFKGKKLLDGTIYLNKKDFYRYGEMLGYDTKNKNNNHKLGGLKAGILNTYKGKKQKKELKKINKLDNKFPNVNIDYRNIPVKMERTKE